MSQYGIMRVEKRGRSAVYGLQIENEREPEDGQTRTFDASDIDWERTAQNEHLIQSKTWNKDITEKIKAAGCKEKKNSIVMLDGFYGASKEWFDTHTKEEADAYFRACKDYHVKAYCQGDESRVVNCVIHWDEATPHMHIESVPLMQDAKGWHLSAKDIMGGRMDYRHRQDEFYEDVSRAYGLERGEVAEYQQEQGRDGERHMKRPEDMKKHLTVLEYKNAKEAEKVQEIQHEKEAAINERDAARREQTQAEAQAAKYRQEAQKAQDAEGQLETVRQELKQTLDMKARASEIHHLFGDKEVQEYHKNMLESTRAIGTEAYEHMKSAEQEHKAAAQERRAAQQLRDETADLTPEKRRAERAAEKAEAAQERAEEYERDIADYIIGTAQNIAEKAVEKATAPEKDDYTQRLEQFMADYQIGGKSLLDVFRRQERERAAQLKKEAERHVFEQEERAKQAARDWDYER